MLAQEINDASNFVTADAPAPPTSVPASVVPVDEAERGGPDGAAVTATHIGAGLAVLATQPVNIVDVAGLGADVVVGTVLGHLEATENDGSERIAVMGARERHARRNRPGRRENVSNGRGDPGRARYPRQTTRRATAPKRSSCRRPMRPRWSPAGSPRSRRTSA